MNTTNIFTHDDYIQEGVSPAQGVIILACTIGDDDENAKNRVAIRKNDLWLDFGLSKEVILSIDAKEDGLAYVLGENGSVVQFNWKTPESREELKASRRVFANSAVANIGPLRRIRFVGGEVICAGTGGQVYQLKSGKFKAFPELIIDGEDLDIEDISGTSPNDLIAVTSNGYGAWFDGSVWQNLDLPTNAILSCISAVGDGRYAIAGEKGTILVGKRDQWEVIPPLDFDQSYWGIAALNQTLYVAHLGGIDVVRRGKVEPLEIPGADDFEFTVLSSGPEGIWSFAGHTVGLITDKGWRTIMNW